MKLDLIDMERIIEVNNLPRVTNTVFIDKDMLPTTDGLFSYEIFGRPGSALRRFQFAYINLKKTFLHPVAYDMINKMDRRINDLIMGAKFFKITATGQLVEDPEGETGMDFFYNNFEKINFSGDSSTKGRQSRVGLLGGLPKNKIFIKKFLVIPPFYRDIDLSSESSMSSDTLSPMYKTLLGLCNAISEDGKSDFLTGYVTDYKIQMTINGIYEYLTSKIAKKNGLIQKNLLGKSVDYAVRAVISGPQIDSNRYDEMQVPYGYIGVPLHLTLVLFFPYIIQQLERFFAAYKNNQLVVTTSGDRIEVVNETVNSLSAKSFERMINLYARSPGSRLTPITMYTGEKDKKVKLNLFNDVLGREFTLTDLLYLVASEVVENKYVYATRYPIEDYRNILTAKVKILTTEKTTKLDLYGTQFKEYPLIDLENVDRIRWVDSVRPNNGYLPGWGGDFDGDMISLRGVFSMEANIEAEQLLEKPMTLLDGAGKPSRGFSKEGILSLYSLTL